ncbi:MAG: DNA translocase FtsK 4TM domain-containing protein [bacterium]
MKQLLKNQRFNEGLGVVLMGAALFALISLLTYHNSDVSFTTPGDGQVVNYGGLVGAYMADILYHLFGASSYLLSLYILLFAGTRFRNQEWNRRTAAYHSIGGVLLVFSLSTFLSLEYETMQIFSQTIHEAGGLLGQGLSSVMLHLFAKLGTYLIVLIILLISFMITTGFSIISFSMKSYAALKILYEKTKDRYIHQKEKEEKTEIFRKKIEIKSKLPKPKVDEKKEVSRGIEVFQEELDFQTTDGNYRLPPLTLLEDPPETERKVSREELLMNSEILEKKLADFGIHGQVTEVHPGPVVTMYEYQPAPGIKVSKIVNLADDLAMAMRAVRVRIVAPLPGKAAVGIEIPNNNREDVYMKEILTSETYQKVTSKLNLALGKNIFGEPFHYDLAKMPHLLVAGATGSGKSVAVNAMIISLLYNATPEEVRMIMVDPKMLELSIYDGIPHLITPVVTDSRKAAGALFWAVREMERRYILLSEKGVRNIMGFNKTIEKEIREWSQKKKTLSLDKKDDRDPGEKPQKLPYLVIVIDELADLMMVAGRDVEEAITRLSQMARAAGIHLIMATQRPSTDVITGIIKANFPARISFQVSSKYDSRTILDTVGSEHLLGKGDMLFMPPASSQLIRLHGSFLSDDDIRKVVEFVKKQGTPEYDDEVLTVGLGSESDKEDDEPYDEFYDAAVQLVIESRQASISMLQRRLRVGYNRAARMIERMEKERVVGPADGARPREVLVGKDFN